MDANARLDDIQTALTELRTGQAFTGTHHETFAMRPEQAAAVDKATAYYHSIWAEDEHACRGSCGTRRCGSARPSPPTSSPRARCEEGCWW